MTDWPAMDATHAMQGGPGEVMGVMIDDRGNTLDRVRADAGERGGDVSCDGAGWDGGGGEVCRGASGSRRGGDQT